MRRILVEVETRTWLKRARISAAGITDTDRQRRNEQIKNEKTALRAKLAAKHKGLRAALAMQAKEGAITEKLLMTAVEDLVANGTTPHKVRKLAADKAGISRARADQILGPIRKTQARK